MEEGLRFENSLSDEALHALFWDLVQRHGIPLSDELRESAVDNGGHAQQIAVILDALCRSYQEATETAIEDNVEIITAGPDTYKSHQIVTEKDGGNFVVGQSFSFGSHSGEVFDSEPRYGFFK